MAELSTLIGDSGQGQGEGVRRTRELPTPIRLGLEALRRAVDFEVQFWAVMVAEECCTEIGLDRMRLHVRVGRAADFLVHRVPQLLELGPCERPGWSDDGEAVDEVEVHTGLEGALRLVRLHERVRTAAGRGELVHHLTPACPWCDHRTLVRHNGASQVECENCTKIIPEATYDWFVAATITEEQRRKLEEGSCPSGRSAAISPSTEPDRSPSSTGKHSSE